MIRTRLPGLANAALDHIGDAQFLGDLLQVHRLALVGEDGIAAEHEQARNLRQVGDDVLGDAVAEELLLGVVAHVGERQDRHRRLVGARRASDRRAAAAAAPLRAASQIDEIDMHRLGDVLDRLLALIEELQLELVADLVAHHRRAGDAARPRQTLEPRRHVDAVAIEIVAVDDDVAEIDADAELDVPVLGNPGIALRHAALDFDRAARRIQNAAELDQEAVAHHLEDAPAMLGDGGIEELAAMLAKRAERALFIGLHEPAVADDVGRQDGRQPPLNLLLAQSIILSTGNNATRSGE